MNPPTALSVAPTIAARPGDTVRVTLDNASPAGLVHRGAAVVRRLASPPTAASVSTLGILPYPDLGILGVTGPNEVFGFFNGVGIGQSRSGITVIDESLTIMIISGLQRTFSSALDPASSPVFSQLPRENSGI